MYRKLKVGLRARALQSTQVCSGYGGRRRKMESFEDGLGFWVLGLGFRSLTWPRYPARSHFGFRSRHPSVACHCPARPNAPARPLRSHISRHRQTLHTHAFSARLRARRRRSCETDLPPRGDHWSRRACVWTVRQRPPRMRHWLNGCEHRSRAAPTTHAPDLSRASSTNTSTEPAFAGQLSTSARAAESPCTGRDTAQPSHFLNLFTLS